MAYVKNNPRNFHCANNFTPFLIATMKFVAGFATEIVNILMIV